MSLPLTRALILGLLFLSTAINYIDRLALSVLLPQLRGELGISSFAYGYVTTCFMLAYAMGQPLAGMAIDRIGAKLGLSLAVFFWSVAAGLHALAAGVLSLAMLRLLLGFSEAGNWPAGAKAITEWFPQQRRAFAMGVFDAGSAVGAVLAPPLVAALAMACGWRATFVAVAVLGLAWVPAWGWIYGSPNERPTAAQNLKDSATPSSWLRCAVGSRQIWGLLTMRMFATPVWWFYVLWLPDYLSQVRQFSLKEIGLFGWIPYLVADIGKLAGGHWSDWLLRRGASANLARKSVMLAGALMMVAGVMVIGAGSGAVALAWVSVATFGFGVWSPNVYAIHGDIFPSAMMARAIGTTGLGASLGGAFFSFLTGVLVQWYGYPSAFLIAGLSAPVACLALFFWVGRVEPIRTQPSSALAIRTSSSG